MGSLKFTDIELEIKDLSARARALDEEAGSDVLGGWGPFRRLKRAARRTARRARSRFNAVRRSRGVKRAMRWRNRKPFPGRRQMKQGLMMKAKFHERKASLFRAAAARI